MTAPMLELRCRQRKTVIVDGATIRIIKRGSLFAAQREKTFPIRNISSVEVKKPGIAVGFIQFSIAGGAVRDSSFTLTGGAFDAVKDENSAVFTSKGAYQTALKIKEYVETYQAHLLASPGTSPSARPSVSSVADEIVKLKALMDQGVISPQEFETQKRRLLQS
jgi:hypothetical protein